MRDERDRDRGRIAPLRRVRHALAELESDPRYRELRAELEAREAARLAAELAAIAAAGPDPYPGGGPPD